MIGLGGGCEEPRYKHAAIFGHRAAAVPQGPVHRQPQTTQHNECNQRGNRQAATTNNARERIKGGDSCVTASETGLLHRGPDPHSPSSRNQQMCRQSNHTGRGSRGLCLKATSARVLEVLLIGLLDTPKVPALQ